MNQEQKSQLQESSIYFHYKDEQEPVIKIIKDKFFLKGEEIQDIHNVYERFHEWLKNSETKEL